MDKQEMQRREAKAAEWLVPALERTFNQPFSLAGSELVFKNDSGIQQQISAAFDGISFEFKLGKKQVWRFFELCFYIREAYGLEFKAQ